MANYVLDYSGSQINTKLGNATTTSSGVMSAEDKIKLNGIENEANKTLIDDTLTEEGQAADAKATGDAILDLQSDVSDIQGITGNGQLSGFTATDLTDAANELKNTLTELEDEVIISDTQPTDTNNKLWVKESSSSDGISIPTMTDIQVIENILTQLVSPNAGSHNNIYRGENLGSSVTAAQYAEINAGTFNDLFIGDYWVIGGVNYRIAAFDYWLNTGDGSRCQTHHVVIVPDSSLTSAKMNNSTVTTGAYIGSDFYTGANSNTARTTAQSMVKNAFGSTHILSHREYLMNAVTNGYESGQSLYDVEIELMNELMVYGSNIFHNIQNGTNIPSNYTISKSQLPLFQHCHDLIANGGNWWLRDVVSSDFFVSIGADGNTFGRDAAKSGGIRPAFAIKA